jgi:hypothetical protein
MLRDFNDCYFFFCTLDNALALRASAITRLLTTMKLSSVQATSAHQPSQQICASIPLSCGFVYPPACPYPEILVLCPICDGQCADGLVLFNRFYQPDFDLENLEVVPNLQLSTSYDIRLPLRWIAILYGRISVDFALTSGVHTAHDVLKAIMAGANVAMTTSALLEYGIGHASQIVQDLQRWMTEHEYESITQMRGSMSLRSVTEPAAFERANYMKALNTFHV